MTNIILKKISVCKRHFLQLVSILANEKIHFVSICDSTIFKICQRKKPTIGNIVSCFSHHWRRHLMFLTSNWYHFKINNSFLISSFVGSLELVVCSKYPNCNPDKKYIGQQNLYLILSKDANVHNI